MKRIFLICIVGAILTSPAFSGPTVTVDRETGYWNGMGGEYTLKPSAELSWVLKYYDSKAKDVIQPETFQSFCIELGESVLKDGTTEYDVVLNDSAIYGGVGPAGDPISIGTAWLYHEFQNGTLEYYDYNPAANRSTTARQLQDTIWWLEDELSVKPTNNFMSLLTSEFGSPEAAKENNAGRIGVQVLNLYDPSGNLAQDMLVCVPSPGAVLLCSIGAGLVGWLRRYKTL